MAADLPIPTHARNMRLLGHSDQGGRGDGQQIMVQNGHAYIGHVCSRGFSVLDVRDPRAPRTVNYIENPPNTWSLHLQVHDNLLLLILGDGIPSRGGASTAGAAGRRARQL